MALSYINNKEIKFGSSRPLNGVYTPGSPTREYEPLDSLGIYLNSGIPLSYGVENGRYMSMSDEFAATSQGNSYSFNQLFAAQMMLGFKLHDRFIACDTEHKIIGTEPLLHKAYLAEITEKTLDYFKIKIYEDKTRTFCIRMSSSEVPTSYVDLTNSFDENGLNLTQTDRQSFLSYYRFYPLTARDPSSRFEETLGVDYYLLPSVEGLKELSGDILSKFNAFISSDGTLTNLGNTAFAYAGDINYVPNYRGETSEAAVSAAESARVILGQVEEMHADINQILPEMKENLELTKQYRDEAMSTEIGTVREDLNQLKGDLNELDGLMADVFDKNILLKNSGYIGSNGVVEPNGSAKYTDYEDISSYDTLTYSTSISEAALELAFYDANKNLLSDISVLGSTATAERTINLTDAKYSNAKYVILSCYGEGNFTRFYCIASKNNLNKRVVYLEHNAITEDEIISYIPENGNQFNKDTVKVGYEVYGDGSIVEQGESAVSDYIYVKGHSAIYITNLPVYAGMRYGAFYDENKTFISLGAVSNQISQGVVTIPNGACYYVISLYQRWTSGSKDYDNVMVSFSGYKEYEPFIECIGEIKGLQIPKTETMTSTKDKKMLIFGDSITETATISDDGSTYTEGTRTNWMTFAKGYLQIDNFKNYAKSGATYKDRSNASFRQQLSDQINLAMADSNNDDAEIIVVSLGTNDGTTSFGDYETAMSKTSLDELDRTKLYEAIRWAMWTLRTKYEDATFFAALPIQRADGEHPFALLNAITEMAHRYNFIIIDAQNESGIVRDFEVSGAKGRYLYDGLHPNADGAEKMAKLYSNVILRNFIAN